MNLHMHQKELETIAESILLQSKQRISAVDTLDENKNEVHYFIFWDKFMILETLKPIIKNEPEYSTLSNTYQIDFEKLNKGKEKEVLLYLRQLLNCVVIYELPKKSKEWLTSLEKALAKKSSDVPLMGIVKDKEFSELLSAFEKETGAKKYDYSSDFKTNNLDICFAMVRDFSIEQKNFKSDLIRQVVLDPKDFYYLESHLSKQQYLNEIGLVYEVLGLFSKKPNKKKIYINNYKEKVEVGECLDCGTLLEEQANAANKFSIIASLVEKILLSDLLYSRYLTMEQLKEHLKLKDNL